MSDPSVRTMVKGCCARLIMQQCSGVNMELLDNAVTSQTAVELSERITAVH